MLVGIDHLIIAWVDPEAAAGEIERVLGLRASGGGRHEAFGTFNRLVWLGDSYLELVGIFDAALAGGSWWGPHLIGLLEGASNAFAGLALATDDLAADVARLHGQGAPVSDPIDGQRARPDGDVVRWRISRMPEPDPELGLMLLIEHDTTAAEWRPAERAERSEELHPIGTSGRLARVELPVSDVRSATMRLLRGFGLQFRPSLAGAGARDTSVGAQTLRLAPATDAPSITVRAGHDRRRIDLLGLHWLIEPN